MIRRIECQLIRRKGEGHASYDRGAHETRRAYGPGRRRPRRRTRHSDPHDGPAGCAIGWRQLHMHQPSWGRSRFMATAKCQYAGARCFRLSQALFPFLGSPARDRFRNGSTAIASKSSGQDRAMQRRCSIRAPPRSTKSWSRSAGCGLLSPKAGRDPKKLRSPLRARSTSMTTSLRSRKTPTCRSTLCKASRPSPPPMARLRRRSPMFWSRDSRRSVSDVY
jgi:hypothetical protein